MRNILVPKLFGFAKIFHFSSFASPSSVELYCLLTERHQDFLTSLYSLMTLYYLKISYMILTKLGALYFNTLACFDVCCQGTELEISVSL